MLSYSYIALDKKGAKQSGTINAIDELSATNQIEKLGLIPKHCSRIRLDQSLPLHYCRMRFLARLSEGQSLGQHIGYAWQTITILLY